MDPEGTHYKTFLENNNHLPLENFQEVKGSDLSKKEIISQGLAIDDLASTTLLTSGAVGCAASHRAIWQNASKTTTDILYLKMTSAHIPESTTS